MTVTEVKPAGVKVDPPKAIVVVPSVIDEFVNALLGMLVSVLVEPLIDLFVSVSVVARPTSVSVLVGRVKTPVLLICAITGVVSVLLVSVWVPVRVTTVESMLIVLAAEPSKVVPESSCRPVLTVNGKVVVAVIVPDAPKATVTPL